MSCTDKNTMVFVVLEGEITVILHTTQFNAKKGDSFYIPPKVGLKKSINDFHAKLKLDQRKVVVLLFPPLIQVYFYFPELLQPDQPEGSGGWVVSDPVSIRRPPPNRAAIRQLGVGG